MATCQSGDCRNGKSLINYDFNDDDDDLIDGESLTK